MVIGLPAVTRLASIRRTIDVGSKPTTAPPIPGATGRAMRCPNDSSSGSAGRSSARNSSMRSTDDVEPRRPANTRSARMMARAVVSPAVGGSL